MLKTYCVIGLQHGDEAKGKVTHELLSLHNYNACFRASGGPNAGHTIYNKGTKIVTHHVPSGVFFGIPSYIGAGCVIHLESFLEEISMLNKSGFNTSKVRIYPNAHMILDSHIKEDKANNKVGTTGKGIAYCLRDKYLRVGKRACEIPELQNYIGLPDFSTMNQILIEGAQGSNLCIDWGDYPYVTSSPPSVAYMFHSIGTSVKSCAGVFGVIKAYDTYVGTKKFEGDGKVFDDIRIVGSEFGSTTGRARQVNWLNIDDLKRQIIKEGVDTLVVNKRDVLDTLGIWNVFCSGSIVEFPSAEEFRKFIQDNVGTPLDVKIVHSCTADGSDLFL